MKKMRVIKKMKLITTNKKIIIKFHSSYNCNVMYTRSCKLINSNDESMRNPDIYLRARRRQYCLVVMLGISMTTDSRHPAGRLVSAESLELNPNTAVMGADKAAAKKCMAQANAEYKKGNYSEAVKHYDKERSVLRPSLKCR